LLAIVCKREIHNSKNKRPKRRRIGKVGKNLIKKILVSLFIFCISLNYVYALELDMSVDEEIKKKYNSTRLEDEILPALPNITKTTTSSNSNSKTTTYSTTAPKITQINSNDGIKIPNRTKFQAKSSQTISDWTQKGAQVSFTTTSPVSKTYITIPAGTKIYGKVINSHRPQITGNGGLIIVEITGMNYNGKNYELNGKITKAANKKIFFNRIKGKRGYIAGVKTQIDKGDNFYAKTKKISNRMSSNAFLVILSPVPKVVGFVGSAVCTIISPITGLSAKGQDISISSGGAFEIKLLEPAYVK
jgi:hypothetical protein